MVKVPVSLQTGGELTKGKAAFGLAVAGMQSAQVLEFFAEVKKLYRLNCGWDKRRPVPTTKREEYLVPRADAVFLGGRPGTDRDRFLTSFYRLKQFFLKIDPHTPLSLEAPECEPADEPALCQQEDDDRGNGGEREPGH